jgi:hypothetical protein
MKQNYGIKGNLPSRTLVSLPLFRKAMRVIDAVLSYARSKGGTAGSVFLPVMRAVERTRWLLSSNSVNFAIRLLR